MIEVNRKGEVWVYAEQEEGEAKKGQILVERRREELRGEPKRKEEPSKTGMTFYKNGTS